MIAPLALTIRDQSVKFHYERCLDLLRLIGSKSLAGLDSIQESRDDAVQDHEALGADGNFVGHNGEDAGDVG